MKKALRRHLTNRKIKQRVKKWKAWDYEAPEPHQWHKWNGACGCIFCRGGYVKHTNTKVNLSRKIRRELDKYSFTEYL